MPPRAPKSQPSADPQAKIKADITDRCKQIMQLAEEIRELTPQLEYKDFAAEWILEIAAKAHANGSVMIHLVDNYKKYMGNFA